MVKRAVKPARKALGSRPAPSKGTSLRRKRAHLTEDEALARLALARMHEKEHSLDEVMRRAGYALDRHV